MIAFLYNPTYTFIPSVARTFLNAEITGNFKILCIPLNLHRQPAPAVNEMLGLGSKSPWWVCRQASRPPRPVTCLGHLPLWAK